MSLSGFPHFLQHSGNVRNTSFLCNVKMWNIVPAWVLYPQHCETSGGLTGVRLSFDKISLSSSHSSPPFLKAQSSVSMLSSCKVPPHQWTLASWFPVWPKPVCLWLFMFDFAPPWRVLGLWTLCLTEYWQLCQPHGSVCTLSFIVAHYINRCLFFLMSSEFSSSQRGMIVGEEINKTLLNSVSDRADLSADWCGGGGGDSRIFS